MNKVEESSKVRMSRIKSTLGSYKIRGFVDLLRLYRSRSNNAVANGNGSNVAVAVARPHIGDIGSMQLAGVRFIHAAKAAASSSGSSGDNIWKPTPTPLSPSPKPPPRPRGRGFPKWVKIVLGSVFSLLLAFWTPKWTALLKIGGEAEMVIQEAEQAAEVVEKVANVMEKVSEELADSLPDGNKIKEAAMIVEHVTKETAKDAHIAEEILHKVDVVKHDIEDVEQIVEPFMDKMAHDHDMKSNEAVKR